MTCSVSCSSIGSVWTTFNTSSSLQSCNHIFHGIQAIRKLFTKIIFNKLKASLVWPDNAVISCGCYVIAHYKGDHYEGDIIAFTRVQGGAKDKCNNNDIIRLYELWLVYVLVHGNAWRFTDSKLMEFLKIHPIVWRFNFVAIREAAINYSKGRCCAKQDFQVRFSIGAAM